MSGYKVQQDYELTIETGSTWGTAVNVFPLGLPSEEMKISIEPTARRLKRAQNVRGQTEDNTWQDTGSSIPTAEVSVIMTPQLNKILLPGILQKTPNWSSTGSVYDMSTKNFQDLPKPVTNDEGYFYTLGRKSPQSNDSEVLASAIPNSMTLKIHPVDNEGILMADIQFIGKNYARSQSFDAPVTQSNIENMYRWKDITAVSFGPFDIFNDFVSLELNITNGTKFVSDIPTGEIVFPNWEINGTFKVTAGEDSETMKNYCNERDVNSGETLKIVFGNSPVSATGDLTLTSFCYLTNPDAEYEEGEVITFSFEGVFGTIADDEVPLRQEFYYNN